MAIKFPPGRSFCRGLLGLGGLQINAAEEAMEMFLRCCAPPFTAHPL
jgi:hypothetical protein